MAHNPSGLSRQLLTLIPQAPLLSATGRLFPSALSDSLVPFVCFAVTVMALTFGFTTGRLTTLRDMVRSLTIGFGKWSSLFLLYILGMEFYLSFCYFWVI